MCSTSIRRCAARLRARHGAARTGRPAASHPGGGRLPARGGPGPIRAREGLDRGWYAGPVGWLDAAGDGEFAVALRSGLVHGDDRPRSSPAAASWATRTPTPKYAEIAREAAPDACALRRVAVQAPGHEADTHENPFAYVGAFADELVRAGVQHVCLCPGSRSTPLALMLARQRGLRLWTLVDERSAASLRWAWRRPACSRWPWSARRARRRPTSCPPWSRRTMPACRCWCSPPTARPNCAISARRRPLTRCGSTAATPSGSSTWPCPRRRDGDAALRPHTGCPRGRHRRDGPAGPVHLNFPFREPLVPEGGPRLRPAAGRRQTWPS